MSNFTYAFGSRSAFMAEPFTYRTVELAFKGMWGGGGDLVYVYEGAQVALTRDGYEGGKLVGVVEFKPILDKVTSAPKPWKHKQGFPFFELLERYIRLMARCQSK
jgi:hypothetical protein